MVNGYVFESCVAQSSRSLIDTLVGHIVKSKAIAGCRLNLDCGKIPAR